MDAESNSKPVTVAFSMSTCVNYEALTVLIVE